MERQETDVNKLDETEETTIPRRYITLTSISAITGFSIGMINGTRKASWQFLAENAHRAPTTYQGWYFYNKTKNYKMLFEGMKRGMKDGLRIGGMGMCFAGLEDWMERVGIGRVKEIGAGIGSGIVVGLICKL